MKSRPFASPCSCSRSAAAAGPVQLPFFELKARYRGASCCAEAGLASPSSSGRRSCVSRSRRLRSAPCYRGSSCSCSLRTCAVLLGAPVPSTGRRPRTLPLAACSESQTRRWRRRAERLDVRVDDLRARERAASARARQGEAARAGRADAPRGCRTQGPTRAATRCCPAARSS